MKLVILFGFFPFLLFLVLCKTKFYIPSYFDLESNQIKKVNLKKKKTYLLLYSDYYQVDWFIIVNFESLTWYAYRP